MVVGTAADNLFSSNIFTARELEDLNLEEPETSETEYEFTAPSDIFTPNPETLNQIRENAGIFRLNQNGLDDPNMIWQTNTTAKLPEFNPEAKIESEQNISEKIANINNNLKKLDFNQTTNIEDIKAYKEELDAAEATIKEAVLSAPGQRLGMAVNGTRQANNTVQHLQRKFDEAAQRLLKDEKYSEENKTELRKLLKEEEQVSNIDRSEETWNGSNISGAQVLVEGDGKATWYDPALGGINGNGDGRVSTGARFDRNKFSAAAFPELLRLLPKEYTRSARGFRGGITLAKPVNLLVKDTKTGKKIILSLNDVGPGTRNHASNHYLDLSPAAKNALGASNIGSGLRISIAPQGSQPGNYIANAN